LRVYNFIFWILTPCLHYFLRQRIKRGKEDKTRFREKMGLSALPKPSEKIIWINAVSVGEALAVIPLIERLPEIYPPMAQNMRILLTTSTTSAATIVKDRLPPHALHQYTVIDHPLYVKRFLDHWQPVAAFWVESELWPNMIAQTAKRSIPMALINARFSRKTVKNWSRAKFFARFLFSRFDICLVQNETNKDALIVLGASPVVMSGNLKYDAKPLVYDQTQKELWQERLQGNQVFLAASTHIGEDETIIQTHRDLLKQGKKIKTIIAPRHPQRAQSIIEKTGSLKTALYSQDPLINLDVDIYIIDRVGVLGLFYALADVVFMGGSLIERGGQNPLEPARLDCALFSGAHTFNFEEVYTLLQQKGAVQVVCAKTLTEKLSHLLDRPEKIKTMAEEAKKSADSLKGALDITLAALKPNLDKINVASS
jgi:3-deoxy-D-manno-octulosonic-acid transferase